MAQRLRIENFADPNVKEKSFLAADATAPTTGLTVENNQNFANNDIVFLGILGGEDTEQRVVASTSGAQSVTLSAATANNHLKYDEVTICNGNQIRIYQAANVDGTPPADGSFSVLTTIAIDPDNLTTDYTDAAGSSSRWYKFTYYNSTTTSETLLSDSIPVRGGQTYYTSLYAIKREAGFTNSRWMSDTIVSEKREAAQSEVNSYLNTGYTVPFTEPIPPIVENVTRLLAAAYLLLEEYGTTADGSNKDGQAKLAQARQMLADLRDRKISIMDASGNSLLSSTQVTGWPDDTTKDADAADNGGDFMFKATDKF